METAIKGIQTDFDKFERLKAEYWKQVSAGVWACKSIKHILILMKSFVGSVLMNVWRSYENRRGM